MKRVLYFLGLIFLVIAGIMLILVPTALFFGELTLIPWFLIPAATALILGFLLMWKFERKELTLGHAMVLVASTWILLSLFGSIPYIFGSGLDFLSAWFESMSGFTATGLTMFEMGETGAIGAHQTILFWRSVTEWVGGLGVIVLFLAALLGAGKAARRMYEAEARTDRVEVNVRLTAKSIWKIYLLYTILGALAFYFVGMPLWESINHSMTGIATGGFSVTADSFAGYNSPELVIAVIIMLMGATSFAVHRKLIGGQWREFFGNIEVKMMFFLIALATIVLVWSVGFEDAVFQSASALTGTGFSVAEQAGPNQLAFVSGDAWGPLQKSILSCLMISGGGFGSTSSAIKLIRTVIILKAVYWLIKRSFLPKRAVVPFKLGGEVYSEGEVMQTSVYAFIYLLVLMGGALITMMAMSGASAIDVFFESASAQGNVGLSTGVTSITMPAIAKGTFIIQMLFGRLEILPVFALIGHMIAKIPRRREAF